MNNFTLDLSPLDQSTSMSKAFAVRASGRSNDHVPNGQDQLAADLPLRVTISQIQALPEQFSNTTRKTDGSPRCRRRHLVGTSQQVGEALLMQ
jgi:hypothetical protein